MGMKDHTLHLVSHEGTSFRT
uniref:Uncharacterized protein n=1 Tax=Anguilla anguilla TaxID=7936 RepID=A0A0E9PQY3_ANGAN